MYQDIHEFRVAIAAFAIKHVEGTFQIVEIHGRADEAGGHVEFAV